VINHFHESIIRACFPWKSSMPWPMLYGEIPTRRRKARKIDPASRWVVQQAFREICVGDRFAIGEINRSF
jgi:hypothetical protein